MTDVQGYIKSLAREYIGLCDLMTSHHYHSEDERAVLSRDRSWCHDELIRLLGPDYARPFDMQAYCRTIVRD